MTVPETTIHKNNFAPGRENQIGFARKLFAVQPVAIAHRMGQTPHGHFWFGVFAFHRLHGPASFE